MTEDLEPEQAKCSSRGCMNSATWEVLWNNPKIHTPDRRKVWLACEEHKSTLSDYLDARAFLRDVVPHQQTVTDPVAPE